MQKATVTNQVWNIEEKNVQLKIINMLHKQKPIWVVREPIEKIQNSSHFGSSSLLGL